MIKIYTDGSASMNFVNGEYQRGNGGSAMAIINDKEEIEYSASKHFDNTTNNYCELYAILMALSYCSVNYSNDNIFEINSDSAYCVNMLKENGWIYSWEKNNWTRGKKHEPIENLPIIKKIWELLDDNVTFIKVKGHAGNQYNELVDKMAVEAKEKGEWFDEIH